MISMVNYEPYNKMCVYSFIGREAVDKTDLHKSGGRRENKKIHVRLSLP